MVIPNLWGGLVGRPGTMKSPAFQEVLKPVHKLERKADEQHQEAYAAYEQSAMVAKSRKEEVERRLKAEVRDVQADEARLREIAAEVAATAVEPTRRRYLLNDSTVEKLGEVLSENPNGVLLFRDELPGFFRSLEKPGREADRAFYLEAWNGNGSFTFDRIGRGTKYIDAMCLSIPGGIQPGPLSDYFQAASRNGSEDDGLIARFQLLVYPDDTEIWVNVDRWPDRDSFERARAICERLDKLDGLSIGASYDDFGGLPYLRFANDAHELFDWWRHDLENLRLKAVDEDPLILSHLGKYRSLMPKLALLFHLIEAVDGKASGLVSLSAAEMAAAWCDLLEGHARRVYGGHGDPASVTARQLAERIKQGKLDSPFKAHDIAQRGWRNLDTTQRVWMAVERLETLGWVYRRQIEPGRSGGRPKVEVHINPRVLEGKG